MEVANTDCATATTPVSTGPTAGQGMRPSSFDGPIEINVSVLEASKLRPLAGADVTVALIDRRTNATVNPRVGSGLTDAAGKFSVGDRPPSPNNLYSYKIFVRPGPGQDFDERSADLQARSATATAATNGMTDRAYVTLVACPGGMDPLVCEVGQLQVAPVTWKHPSLVSNWTQYKWWVPNTKVLPEEWPEIITNYEQMIRVWNEVPWPRTAMLKDLFARCTGNIPLFKDFKIGDQNLYLNKYSGFWPKTDEEIRRIIATTALQSIPDIYACMQTRVQKKIRDEEKKMKTWRIIGMAAGMLFTGNLVGGLIFSLASQLKQFDDALDFSKFMMGYQAFVEECRTAEKEDFTCTYLAPFILWCMEVLFMGDFFDQIAIEQGLAGARPGLTQEEVVEPMVEQLEASGVEVPKAVYTPGGVAPRANVLPVAAGVGVVGVLALIAAGVFK